MRTVPPGIIKQTLMLIVLLMTVTLPFGTAAAAWSCDDVDAAVQAGTPESDQDSAPPAVFPDDGGTLTVFAAASLTDPFLAIESTLEASYPGLEIIMNFAGSQTLVTQAVEGAPVDVLALAAVAPMERAREEGLIAGSAHLFASNVLTVIVPSDNSAGIESAAGLGSDDPRLVLAAPDVPAGVYARESVCLMGDDPETYGEGFVDRVAANVVSEENNVKAVLAKVALGEADAGIVYVSDVTEDVVPIPIPGAVNPPAYYPIAAVVGPNLELAQAFIGYVLSAEGQDVLAEWRFLPVD